MIRGSIHIYVNLLVMNVQDEDEPNIYLGLRGNVILDLKGTDLCELVGLKESETLFEVVAIWVERLLGKVDVMVDLQPKDRWSADGLGHCSLRRCCVPPISCV